MEKEHKIMTESRIIMFEGIQRFKLWIKKNRTVQIVMLAITCFFLSFSISFGETFVDSDESLWIAQSTSCPSITSIDLLN